MSLVSNDLWPSVVLLEKPGSPLALSARLPGEGSPPECNLPFCFFVTLLEQMGLAGMPPEVFSVAWSWRILLEVFSNKVNS